MKQERMLAIHDISCIGRCSLTVALPIISATGIECSVLPTAVLSTHTGGFTGFTYRDLTDDMIPIDQHWGTLGIRFKAVYTGFLGSFEQIDIVKRIIEDISDKDTTIYVDPVMADKGKLYPVFGPDFPKGMRSLCERADVIIPNLTELAFMMGTEYTEGPYTREYISDVLEQARCFGTRKIVITGVSFKKGTIGAVYMDYETGETGEYMTPEIPGYFHGSGDVFGSSFVGAAESGASLGDAVAIAVRYTYGSIERTVRDGTDVRYGVNFEEGIHDYIEDIAESLVKPVFLEAVTADDMVEITDLIEYLYHQIYRFPLPEEQVDYMIERFQTPENLLRRVEEGYCHRIVSLDGFNAGYFSYIHKNGETRLTDLYIDKSCRRIVAKKALEYIIADARRNGSTRINYNVNVLNINIIEACMEEGFRDYGKKVVDIGSGYVLKYFLMELVL